MKRSLLMLSALLLAACGDDAEDTGSGNVRFTVYGEDYIEQEIPAEDFEDGWAVTFTKFAIVLGDVSVADRNAGEAGRLSSTQLFDLTKAGPHAVGELSDLEARSWDEVGYRVPAVESDTEVHSSATAGDLATMQDGGYSLWVAGTATKGSTEKTFEWAFTNSTSYDRCVSVSEAREVPGVTITNGGTENVELTIHGDHFFYDDLASEEAVLRFDAMAAADADEDGEVTLEELSAVKLVDIPEGTYGTGSASHVDDLGAFVTALTASLGHFRGEGHCVATEN